MVRDRILTFPMCIPADKTILWYQRFCPCVVELNFKKIDSPENVKINIKWERATLLQRGVFLHV